MNTSEQIVYNQPTTIEDRAAIAQTCVLKLDFEMPMLLDAIDNEVDTAYSALPERLYVIDREGAIAWRSGPGPWGFDVDGWEKALLAHID